MKLSKTAVEQAEMLEDVIHSSLPASRRNFLKKGALLAAVGAGAPIIGSVFSGCSDDEGGSNPTDDGNANQSDIDILGRAYLTERLAVNTYVAANATGLLVGPFQEVALSFVADHEGHAASFRDVIVTTLGGEAPADPADNENFITGINGGTEFQLTPVFGNLTSADGIIKYALALELTAAKQYFEDATSVDASRRLTNAEALAVASDIAPVEAEHAAIFRAALKLLLASETDADAGADIGRSINPVGFISTEVPRY